MVMNIAHVSVLVQMSEGAMENHEHDWYSESCCGRGRSWKNIMGCGTIVNKLSAKSSGFVSVFYMAGGTMVMTGMSMTGMPMTGVTM